MGENFIYCIPEILQDKRLSLNQIKVLLALFSFRNKTTNLCFPTRNSISEKTGIRVTTVSDVTTELVSLNWVSKKWHDSKYKYEVTIPDASERSMSWPEYRKFKEKEEKEKKEKENKNTDTSTVPSVSTVPPVSTNEVLGDSTHNRDKLTEIIIKPPNPQIPEWLDLEIWESFKEHRKAKRSKITPTTQKMIFKKLEAWKESGHNPNQILENSIVNGWQGIFEPENRKIIQAQTKFPSKFERDMETSSHLKRSLENERNREIDNSSITGIQRELPPTSN